MFVVFFILFAKKAEAPQTPPPRGGRGTALAGPPHAAKAKVE